MDHQAPTLDALLPEVYGSLRSLAARLWRGGSPGASVNPTMLVHEVYLRMAKDPGRTWEGRSHVLAVAARAMRQVVADRARRRGAVKRGGDLERVTLTGVGEADDPVDLLALDAALAALTEVDARKAEVFVLRAMGGMEVEEVAEALGVSPRTVKSDWRVARAWLVAHLRGEQAAEEPG